MPRKTIATRFQEFTGRKLSDQRYDKFKKQLAATMDVLNSFEPQVIIKLKKTQYDVTDDVANLKRLCGEYVELLNGMKNDPDNMRDYIREFKAHLLHLLTIELYALSIKALTDTSNEHHKFFKTYAYETSKKFQSEAIKVFDPDYFYDSYVVNFYITEVQSMLDTVKEEILDSQRLSDSPTSANPERKKFGESVRKEGRGVMIDPDTTHPVKKKSTINRNS